MSELEGVIKYRLDYEQSETVTENVDYLNTWRSILHGLGLIGQDSSRYAGYGFGNLSQRSQVNDNQFVISGTQTGNLEVLEQSDYVCVNHCDIDKNHVIARGPVKPSSEALTHSMFYQLEPSIQCVIHVHSPVLWRFGLDHDYPVTDVSVEYGTREMATEISRLYLSGRLLQQKTLVMAGHEDGVICFGDSVDQAGLALVTLLSAASEG